MHGYLSDNPQFTSTHNAGYNRNNKRYNNSRSNENNRIATNAHVHKPSSDKMTWKSEDNSNEEQHPSLTKEQYVHVMNLLQHFQGSEGSTSPNLTSRAGNFVYIVVCNSLINFYKPSRTHFKSNADLWIIDSGDSNHMTFNQASLPNPKTLPYLLLVSLPNGYKMKVIQIADVALTPNIILHNVLFVPSFKYNLISVHSLVTSQRCYVLY